jgi:hypothetical protein
MRKPARRTLAHRIVRALYHRADAIEPKDKVLWRMVNRLEREPYEFLESQGAIAEKVLTQLGLHIDIFE